MSDFLRHYYLGIDPGINGAWAAVDQTETLCAFGAGPNNIDSFNAWAWPQMAGTHDPIIEIAYLEEQHVRHSDMKGGKMFYLQKLLINYGMWQGMFDVMNIKYKLIHPLTWMARYKCADRMPSDMRKKAYLNVAKFKFQGHKWLCKDHDVAAAALLALMARDDDMPRRLRDGLF